MVSRFALKICRISLVLKLLLHDIWSTKSLLKWLKIFRRKLCLKMVNGTSLSIMKPTLSSCIVFIFAFGMTLYSSQRLLGVAPE
jgi:hypothetical protein